MLSLVMTQSNSTSPSGFQATTSSLFKTAVENYATPGTSPLVVVSYTSSSSSLLENNVSNSLIQNNYSSSSLSNSATSITNNPIITTTNSSSVVATPEQSSEAEITPNISNNVLITTETNNSAIANQSCLNVASAVSSSSSEGVLEEKSPSEGTQQMPNLGVMPFEPTLHLSFCEMLQQHNYSTRMSMKMLMILDLANKLVVLVNSKNVLQIKDFIRNDIKNHGIALYGHVGGGQKFIREVINYVGSKRTKRKFIPLTTACIIGCLSMVKFLMKNGANQYQKCLDELPVETAQRYGHKEIVRFLRDFSLDTCHKNRKIRKHFKHSLNEQCGLMSNCFHDVTFTFSHE